MTGREYRHHMAMILYSMVALLAITIAVIISIILAVSVIDYVVCRDGSCPNPSFMIANTFVITGIHKGTYMHSLVRALMTALNVGAVLVILFIAIGIVAAVILVFVGICLVMLYSCEEINRYHRAVLAETDTSYPIIPTRRHHTV